jgi:hypothetical protein
MDARLACFQMCSRSAKPSASPRRDSETVKAELEKKVVMVNEALAE